MPLTRTKPLQPGGRLRPRSKKFAAATRQKRKMYDATRADYCFTHGAGCSGDLTPSHILTQKQWPKHKLNPVNLVWECWPAHCLWENNKLAYAREYPDAFAEKTDRMHRLEPQAYAVFRMKYPTLFPPDA